MCVAAEKNFYARRRGKRIKILKEAKNSQKNKKNKKTKSSYCKGIDEMLKHCRFN
jgi:hypothetical protein